MRNKKRVLMIIPNLDFGGAQNSFSRVSFLLKPHCSLLLVVFNKDNIAPIPLGAELHDLQVPGSVFFGSKFLNLLKRILRLKKIKKEFKPDISISFLEGADYINLLSSQGEQIFFYIHGSKLFDRNIKGFLGRIRKKILIPLFYSRADKILVVNQAISDELKLHFHLKNQLFEVMPNFYDFTEIRKQSEASLSDALEDFFMTNKVICISGRLAPEKGIDRFVKMLPAVFDKHKNVKVILIGEGSERNQIKGCLEKMNITYCEITENFQKKNEAAVLFLGYQQNPYAYMKRSYMLVLPSLNEGMPNTVVEAMGLGIPVVAADCPYGPRELLSTKKFSGSWPEFSAYGILVPVLNTSDAQASWIEALDALISDPIVHERYRLSGYARAHEFSHERMMQQWHKLLDA